MVGSVDVSTRIVAFSGLEVVDPSIDIVVHKDYRLRLALAGRKDCRRLS